MKSVEGVEQYKMYSEHENKFLGPKKSNVGLGVMQKVRAPYVIKITATLVCW